MNETRRFFNPSQPQTLQIGVLLLYINAVFNVLYGAILSPIGLALTAALAAGGYGIANEKKWGYQVGVGAAIVNLALPLAVVGVGGIFEDFGALITITFNAVLVALLVHPHSREYQKIWFR